MNENILLYNQPANEFGEIFPLGNGYLGAMVYGKVKEEVIKLNDDSLWYGGKRLVANPDAKQNLSQIRGLLSDGETEKAVALANMSLQSSPKYMGPFVPLCDLKLFFWNQNNEFNGYTRTLDISNSICNINYQNDGIEYNREMFISYVDNVMAIKITSSKKSMLTFGATLIRRPYDMGSRKKSETSLILEGQAGSDGVKYACVIDIDVIDGSVSVIGDYVSVDGASQAIIYITSSTTFRDSDLEQTCSERIQKAKKIGYEVLKQRHILDYKSLYNRVELDLDYSSNTNYTDQRLADFRQNKIDKGLIELYFNFGRYLLISSSREGTLPANLQGIWNDNFTPAWESKYTININLQMNYWPAEVCNLSECHKPLFELISRMVENGEKTAREVYGCRGFVAHHNTNIWAETNIEGILNSSPIWPMGGAWLSLHLWEHFAYTCDVDFLRDFAYPIMKKAAIFFLDYMFEDNKGRMVTGPSLSPENSYKTEKGSVGCLCNGPSMDSQIIQVLFDKCIKSEALLNLGNNEFIANLKALLDKIPKPEIGKFGQLLEWTEDYEEVDLGHRHISHLFALHPGDLINRNNPELMSAANVTLNRRLEYGGGHTGWSMAWLINMFARLNQGDKALNCLDGLLSKSTYNNLLDKHPPFQIDGNFGGTAGIVEMLMQSHNDMIEFLPALPNAWSNGVLKGVIARGNFEINMYWENGKMTKAVILSLSGNKCKIYSSDSLIVNEVLITANENNIVEFVTSKNQEYIVIFN